MKRLLSLYVDSFRGLPRTVWLASAVTLVNRAGTMVLPFLSLYLVERLGLSTTAAGWFLGAFGLGSIAGSTLGGILAERFGSRRIMIASLIGASGGFLGLAVTERPIVIAALLFLVSMVGDAFRPAVMSYITDASEDASKTRALALLRLAVNAGMALGPAVGGFLAAIDYLWLFVGDATTCFSAGLLALFILPVVDGSDGALASSSVKTAPARPWKDQTFVLFLGLVLLTSCVFFQLLSTVPVWLRQEAGLSEAKIGLFFAVNALTVTFLEMPVVHFAERFRPLTVCSVGAVLVCLGFGLMPLTGGAFGWILATVMVWTLGEMLSAPFSNAVVAHRAPKGRSGRYMGAYGSMWSVALLVAPILGMAGYDRLGPSRFLYLVGSSGILLFFAYRALQRRWDRPERTGVQST
ncbi:MAG: MFS transporter [Thermoanaerobaculia bacterium]|nr:MFS transporter [Thermoanaerobaculia bacterium]